MKSGDGGSLFFPHAHVGTGHCLRDDERSCVNDHTGCLWNNGHNECGHPSAVRVGGYDSPLRKKDNGYNATADAEESHA